MILSLYTVLLLSALRICAHAVQTDEIHSFVNLKPEEFAIVQYDSRPLANYWEASALWNSHYALLHGHRFLYYTAPIAGSDTVGDGNVYDPSCSHADHDKHAPVSLATPWCKVKAMLAALHDFPEVKVFVYLDSDAVISHRLANTTSLGAYMDLIKRKVHWNVAQKPIIFNQDGQCWWCDLIQRVGYSTCLNSGTVAWVRTAGGGAMRLLREWWDSALDPYEGNPLKRKFRDHWPWEQDRQMAVYHRHPEVIQLTSHPDRVFMPRNAGIRDWCFSHLPTYHCFVEHFCANKNSKKVMQELYLGHLATRQESGKAFEPRYLPLRLPPAGR